MSKTGRLGLPYILQGQAQKEVTHNQALNRLDVFVNTVAEDIIDELPATSNDGDIYIVKDKLAQYSSSSWTFYSPFDLMEVTLKSTRAKLIYDGETWVLSRSASKDSEATTPLGSTAKGVGELLRAEQWQEDIILSGASTSSTKFIPDHSSVMAVNIWVIEPITGAASFSIGVKDDLKRYGSGISSTKDTTNVGMTNYPTTYYYDTPIIFTASGGNFTGGVIRVAVQYFKPKGSWPW